jgi:hypothetical protein
MYIEEEACEEKESVHYAAASMKLDPFFFTTVSTTSNACVTNECACPTTSTLSWGSPRNTSATSRQPSPSSCCST